MRRIFWEKSFILLGLIFGLSSGVGTAWADPKTLYIQRFLEAQSKYEHTDFRNEYIVDSGSTFSGIFSQPINPEDPKDKRKFAQRYYMDSSWADGPFSPVIFKICGEGECTAANEFGGAGQEMARKFKAHLVALEHRYYGKSQPFRQLTAENLKYLRVDFALGDLARFHDFAVGEHDLHGKWIAMGGSYSGALAAYVRALYPEKFAGALASSAPVRAKDNFEEYDLHVATVTGAECATKMRKVVAQINAVIDQPERLAPIKRLFDAEDIRDPIDFIAVVADMAAFAVQYGQKGIFCSSLSRSENSDLLVGYAEAGKAQLARFGMTAIQDSPQGAESLNPDDYLQFAGMRQWMYQSCTEFGYYQNAYHDPAVSVRSSLINMDYQYAICKRLFGIERHVDVDVTNRSFYEPVIQAKTSRIFFTNGSNDPWSTLSILPDQVAGLNPALNAFLIIGGSHGDDLRSGGNSQVVEAHRIFAELLSSWLK